jgi:MinD superfamily P-loop ATPase
LETCIYCGECIERCIFGARIFKDEKLEYNPEACLGCGLCVTVCPVEATTMKLRKPKAD